MIHTDGSDGSRTEKEDIEEDPSMRTDAYLRYMQALKDMERETASYNKALPDGNKALDQEGHEG